MNAVSLICAHYTTLIYILLATLQPHNTAHSSPMLDDIHISNEPVHMYDDNLQDEGSANDVQDSNELYDIDPEELYSNTDKRSVMYDTSAVQPSSAVMYGKADDMYSNMNQPSILNPVEVVNFKLLEDSRNMKNKMADPSEKTQQPDEIKYMNRNRYDWGGKNNRRRKQLPLLSRGERETEYDDFLDGEKVPSCRELRKMWKLARKIHQRALETNEIPRSSHPFSRFHSDRVRSSRRFRDRQNANSQPGEKQNDLAGDKEEEIFGTVSYTPGETVKRPIDDSNLREVISQVRNQGRPLSDEKDPGAWNTGIRYMAPEGPVKESPLSQLENNLRESKGMNPRKQNNKNFNNGLSDSWGKISFFAKEKPPSSFEELRSSLKGGSMRGYRDTGSSLSSDDTTFSFSPRRLASSSSPRRLATSSSSRRKSLRKANRNNRRKLNQKRRKGQQRKKFRKTKFYKNLLRKAK